MNVNDIADRMIRAVEIEMKAERVGPAPLRAQQLPYVHSEDDMRNWGHRRGERRSTDPRADACRLTKEDADGHALYRREFWDKVAVSARDVSEAEEATGWYALVSDQDDRAALAGWVYCSADGKRRHFQDWCTAYGIHRETGRRRKDRALAEIQARLARSTVQHCESGAEPVLHDSPVLEDIPATVEDRVIKPEGVQGWRDLAPYQSDAPLDFSWASKRWERRKQREARRRKEAKAA